VLGLGIVWIAVTGLLLRHDLRTLDARVRAVVTLVAGGKLHEARVQASTLPPLADRAEQLTSGPAWWTAAQLPGVGTPFGVARGMTSATARVSRDAVSRLVGVAAALDPNALRSSPNTLRLGPLAAAAPALSQAASAVDAASRSVDALAHSTWLSPIDSSRADLAGQLTAVRGYVDAAARVAGVLPTLLGDHGPQRIFIGLQNEAELRGTGGLPGAFAIAVADHGTVHFTHFESDLALEPPTRNHVIRTGLDFGPAYDAAYGASQPTTTFADSNVSPNFPYAARIWAAMWEKVSGEHVDTVMALDPTVLGYFLSVTGPARLADGTTIDASDVVPLVERDEYSLFPRLGQRKAFVVSVLHAAADNVTSGKGSTLGLVQAASLAAGEQRLLLWSSDPAVQRVVAATHYGGVIPDSARPFVGMIFNNASGGKLDYYVHRSLDLVRTGCGATHDVLVTVQAQNTAPARGLPLYVTARLDRPPPGAKPGDVREIVDYYATRGAQASSVTIDGKPSTVSVLHGLGHPIFRFYVELPRGRTTTIVLHLTEPGAAGRPQIWQQPGVTPLQVQDYEQSCG